MTGSHIDALPLAGAYDGTLGVVGGIAALGALRAAGYRPEKPIEALMFTSEEPTRFGLGCISRHRSLPVRTVHAQCRGACQAVMLEVMAGPLVGRGRSVHVRAGQSMLVSLQRGIMVSLKGACLPQALPAPDSLGDASCIPHHSADKLLRSSSGTPRCMLL